VPNSLDDPCAANRANRVSREITAEYQRGHRCGKILQRDPQGNEGTKEPDGKLNAASCKHQGSDLRTH